MSVALVTGGSTGFGLATAHALSQVGFSVGLVARSPGDLARARAELETLGRPTSTFCADVRDRRQVGDAVDSIESDLGPISALVNNAGTMGAIGPLWEVDQDAWWEDVESSLGGALNLCHRVVPSLIERGRGRIVNVSSYAATRPSPYQSGYACGKAALLTLTEALSTSLSEHGIQAFAVTPGFVETKMTQRLVASPEGRRWVPEAGHGRIVGPEVGARLIARLCSGEADVLSGRFLHALDDLDQLLRQVETIERDDLYVPRVRGLRVES